MSNIYFGGLNSPGNDNWNKPIPNGIFALLLLISFCGIYFSNKTWKPFLEYDDQGMVQLAVWRKDKLNKELDELQEAEQYVLLTKSAGVFPCFSCQNEKEIYLKKGAIWKYGFTTKREIGRYRNNLIKQNLIYVIEHIGTIQECLMRERTSIYNYALLPENLNRVVPLIRPPGNKQDS